MSTSSYRKRVYHVLVHRWGEADDIIAFDGGKANRPTAFSTMDVAVWRPDDDVDVTTFNTLGMSELLMPGADYRVELNFGFRGDLAREEEMAIAAFLANITECPFANSLKLDWWERLVNVPGIPLFPSCHQVLFTPSLGEGGLSCFDAPDHTKLLYVVPVTAVENVILAEQGKDVFLAYCDENDIDILAPRSDPAGG